MWTHAILNMGNAVQRLRGLCFDDLTVWFWIASNSECQQVMLAPDDQAGSCCYLRQLPMQAWHQNSVA